MLGVTFTSRAVLEESESRRKKDKKDKKKKKEKKEKREKRDKKRAGSDSDDSGSGDDEAGLHAKASSASPNNGQQPGDRATDGGGEQEPGLQREDWMTKPMRREAPKLTQEEEEDKRRQEAAAAEPEIFPGLRIMKKADPAAAPASNGTGAAAGAATSTVTAAAAGVGAAGGSGRPGGGGGPLIGDGGASWRLKALRRAQEQAKAEGRSVQEVVGERWGSLAALTEGLSSTAAADGRAHLRAAAERRRAAGAAGEGPGSAVLPHYLQDVRSDRAQMLRPSEDSSLRWRRDGRDAGRGGRRGDEAGRPEGRDRDRDRGEEPRSNGPRGGDAPGGEREAARRGDDEDRGRGADRPPRGADPADRRRADREEDRDEDRGRRDRHRDREQEREREWERERDDRQHDRRERDRPDRDRAHDRERDRDPERERRDRDRDWDRGRGRDQERERGRAARGEALPAAGPRPSREQAAALKQLAGSLNNFADDGSFMQCFMAVQGGQAAKGVKEEPPSDEGDDDADRVRQRIKAEPGAGPSGMDVDLEGGAGSDEDPRVGPRAGPGPRSGGAAEPGMGSGGGGGGGNRAIAAMLRSRAGGCEAAAAGAGPSGRAVREEGGDGDVAGAAAPTFRRAPLFVGGDGGDDDRQAGPSGGGGVASSSGGGGGGAAAGLGNKSAAELLRARLKGLPPPSVGAGAAAGGAGPSAVAVKREPGDDGDGAGPGPTSGPSDPAGPSGSGPRREVVQLPLVDASGRAVRGAFGREAAGAGVAPNAGRRAGTKAPQRYNRETGEKERYFADDDKVDLQTMLRRAKHGDDDMNMDEHLAANIAKKRKFRGTDLDVDAEYDFDGGLEMYESRSKRGNAEAQRARERSRQVSDLRRQAAAEAGCQLCVSNPKRPAHLTVAVGTAAYLCLPARGRLVRGHCCIAPAEHCPSIRGLDEVAWTEVKNFIKCLIRMFGAQGQSVIFMETHMGGGGGRHHAVLDAVPVTERQLEKARGYFKKAILEAESEWSTHHAKACIETTAQKGLRESIPPNFPYFYVQFGYGSGYVHVIDDESKFDPNLGRQVLVGLLDLPPEMAHQRQRSESAAAQQQLVREFEGMWDPFDWTRQLDVAA